jgi:hypothetical protein
MPPTTGSSSGKSLAIDDVVQWLDCLEELVHAVTGDLPDVKAQQTALGVCLKQQVQGSANGTSTQLTPDPSGTGTGTGSVAPIPLDEHPQHVGRHQRGDSDAVDGVNTSHKIEFPKFDGVGNPLPWLNSCERYSTLRGTPVDKRCNTPPSNSCKFLLIRL